MTNFLSERGALRVPPPPLRDVLWKAYVQYVYPSLPLLDLDHFASVVNRGNGETGQLSLLLFQAVMFSGLFFVNMEHLRLAGYSSRKAAINDMFENVKVRCSSRDLLQRYVLISAGSALVRL